MFPDGEREVEENKRTTSFSLKCSGDCNVLDTFAKLNSDTSHVKVCYRSVW